MQSRPSTILASLLATVFAGVPGLQAAGLLLLDFFAWCADFLTAYCLESTLIRAILPGSPRRH